MPWSNPAPRLVAPASRRLSRGRPGPVAGAALALVFLASRLLLHGAPEEKRLSIYSNAANYSLRVVERGGTDYVGLLEVFEPLGKVGARVNGPRWKFHYYEVECEFTTGKTRARIHGNDFDLPANFLLEDDRGLVPLSSLGTLMPQILGGPVSFNQSARRLLIGNVAVHFTAQIFKTATPALVMNFTAAVNPTISTEPGKLRMVFTHDAVVAPGSQALTFDSKVIPSASFQESNGTAEILVNASVPLMASFSNDGRTITIGPPGQTSATAQPATPQPPTSVAVPSSPAPVPAAGSSVPPAFRRYFVVVDPSHGGEERGAALSADLAEKDVTLTFARFLRQELDSRGLATLLLRDSDTTLTLDQRASLTNSAHPALYICVHAASLGSGIRVYTTLLSSSAENRGPFLAWDTAQSSFQSTSRVAAASLTKELQNKQLPVRMLSAPLRPLNNITTATVAIEVAPPSDDVSQLTSAAYLQPLAAAAATGIADVRDKLEAAR